MEASVSKRYILTPYYNSDKLLEEVYKNGADAEILKIKNAHNLDVDASSRGCITSGRRVLEVACGTGDFLCAAAELEKDTFFTGIDYAQPCIERCALQAAEASLTNLIFYNGRAEDFFSADYPDERFDTLFINFPDPWPKKRHFKRRLVRTETSLLYSNAMNEDGELIIATDLDWLHDWHLEIMSSNNNLYLKSAGTKQPPPHPAYLQYSTYQKKGLLENRPVHFAVFGKRTES